MPTRGGARRAAKRSASVVMAKQAPYIRHDSVSEDSVLPEDPALPDRAQYPLRSYVGERSATLEQRLTPPHLYSLAGSELLEDGRLEIEKVRVTIFGGEQTIYLVTGPTNLDDKVAAFKERLMGLVNEYHPDGVDFKLKIAPKGYWLANTSGPGTEDYWHAFEDGIIWTLSVQVAREVRKWYMRACRDYRRDLYCLAEHCPSCQSSNVQVTYDVENPGLGGALLTCKECNLSSSY